MVLDESTRQVLIFTILITTVIGVGIGMFYIYGEFKHIDKEGMKCINNPIKYGGNIMVEKNININTEVLNDSSVLNCNRVKKTLI